MRFALWNFSFYLSATRKFFKLGFLRNCDVSARTEGFLGSASLSGGAIFTLSPIVTYNLQPRLQFKTIQINSITYQRRIPNGEHTDRISSHQGVSLWWKCSSHQWQHCTDRLQLPTSQAGSNSLRILGRWDFPRRTNCIKKIVGKVTC